MRAVERRNFVALAVGLLVSGVLGAGVGGCDDADRGVTMGSSEAMRAVVGVPPLVGVVRAVVPGAEVRSLVPPGQSVHGYELRPSDVKALGEAHLLVGVGLGVDPGLGQYALRRLRPGQQVIQFSSVARLKDASWSHAAGDESGHAHDASHDHDDEQHGHEHSHEHAGPDQHLWLDPALVIRLGGAVAERAIAMIPEGTDREVRVKAIEASLAAFGARVKALDEKYAAELAPLGVRAIVTHHNSFQRVADRYGLKVASVIREMESSEATPGAIAATVEAIRNEGVRAVFFEPAYDAGAAKRIAEAAGVRLGRLDPESSEDWFALMEGNLASLVENLGDKPSDSGDTPTGAPER